jgi:hypothetical protein
MGGFDMMGIPVVVSACDELTVLPVGRGCAGYRGEFGDGGAVANEGLRGALDCSVTAPSGIDSSEPPDLDVLYTELGWLTRLAQIIPYSSGFRDFPAEPGARLPAVPIVFLPSLDRGWEYHDHIFFNLRRMCGKRSKPRNMKALSFRLRSLDLL